MHRILSLFQKRARRVRAKIKEVATSKLRLTVFKSNSNIYAQVIDDSKGFTLASASTLDKSFGEKFVGKNAVNMYAASEVGRLVAERAKKCGISEVVFDRGGLPISWVC
ncbi:large subunit ribosomal protein L18 [Alphaproteobacteria bacterium]